MSDPHAEPTALLVVLHGHLPFVNHPEYEFFLEEDWLFEAVADTYLPLLRMLDGWERDGVDASITVGLSPPLLSMLGLEGLRERTMRYLDGRRTLAQRVLDERGLDSDFGPALRFSLDETEAAIAAYEAAHRDLGHAFARHHLAGRVEIMTCGATHGLMPVLLDEGSIEAQVSESIKTHERLLGIRPRGIWLPECGVTPLAFDALARHDIRFTFCEDRAIRFANPPPQAGPYRPVYTPEGVAFFARDPIAAVEVWSADLGYPGDGRYREFYRDLGYDAGDEHLDPVHKQGTGERKQMGVKLHRITGKVALDEKQPYDPAAARAAIETHADHFATRRIEEARDLREELGVAPALTASFDMELFGHWWHEGPAFLDQALRNLAARQHEPGAPKVCSASNYLREAPRQQVSTPAVSSWGDQGAFRVWVNPRNDWMWRKVHDARLRLGAQVRRHQQGEVDDAGPGSLWHRTLLQATREVLLAQSSDWPFILGNDTQTGYGTRRPLVHLSRAHRLLVMLETSTVDEADLAQIEERDPVFPDVDPSPFARAP